MTGLTEIAEALVNASAGGITRIGTVQEAGETALAYAGVNILRRYMGGVKKIELLFTLSAADTSDRQEQLIEGMMTTLDTLEGYTPAVEGIKDPKVSMTYPPKAVMFSGTNWIYNAGLKVSCYTKM